MVGGIIDRMADWHAILAAHEHEPGVWAMVDSLGSEYGRIELRRVNVGARYKVTFHGEVIGWATSLKVACERVHAHYLRSLGPQGAANSPQS